MPNDVKQILEVFESTLIVCPLEKQDVSPIDVVVIEQNLAVVIIATCKKFKDGEKKIY